MNRNVLVPTIAVLLVVLSACGRKEEVAPAPPKASAPPVAEATPSWPYVDKNKAAAAAPEEYLRRNYYFVLDGSGSMKSVECSGNKPKMDVAKTALLKFINKVPADANVGGLVFDERGVRELAPLAPKAAADWSALINGIRAEGGTPLRSAIRRGYDALTAQARLQLGYGEYHLVVVTDGEANQGEDPRDAVERLTSASPIVLHTIGFCIGETHSLNQPGRVVYRAANNPAALEAGLGDVLAEAPRFDVASFKR